MKWHALLFISIFFLILSATGCDGNGVGACQSETVEYSQGLRVYCYDGWTRSECEDNDKQQVNGASWFFYSGQSCSDRGLDEGSNPWP